MRTKPSFLAIATGCLLGTTAVWAAAVGGGTFVQCNYDLQNKGADKAWDVAIVLNGTYPVATGVGATVNGPFGFPTNTTVGGNTVLHWAGTTTAIGYDDQIHVGYTPQGTHDCPVLDIYWTDANGNRIPTSYVGTAYNHYTNDTTTIKNLSPYPINVTNVRWACQQAALPLAALNATNDYLSRSMVTIGDQKALAPGESWVIPSKPSCSDCYCVTNLTTSGNGLGAVFSPWVQEHVD